MKRLLGILLALCMLFALCACSGSGNNAPSGGGSSAAPSVQSTPAADDGETTYVLRLGAATAGAHPHNVWMEAFEPALEEATGGRIDVQLYPAGQLGNMAELIQGLRDGTVDSAVFPTTYFGTTFIGATVVDLPYLFKDSEQLYRILTENDTKYTQSYEDNGIIPVTYLRLFERQILSAKKIESMADLKNVKLWSLPSAVIQQEVSAMGSVISNLDMGELAPSLQNGTVDGALTDKALFLSQSLYSSAKYLLDAPNDAMVSLYAISPVWWNKLPADLQEIVKQVAYETVQSDEYGYIDDMGENAMKVMGEAGLEVVEPSAAFASELEDTLSTVTSWYLETYPETREIYDELAALVEADNAAK